MIQKGPGRPPQPPVPQGIRHGVPDATNSGFSLYAILVLSRRRKRGGLVFAEALRFERIHEEVYRSLGFELVPIEPGNLHDRCTAIKSSLSFPEIPLLRERTV